MCVLSIEWIWVKIYGKGKRKHNFWAFSMGGTGTKQSGTGTISVLLTVLDQCSYFGHNLAISYPI